MSNAEQDRVWEHSKQRGASLLVILALANRADSNGICWPGQDELAARARISRRSVQRIVDRATAAGEIAVTERPGKSHLYVVLVGLRDEERSRRLDLVAVKIFGTGDILTPQPVPDSHTNDVKMSYPDAQDPAQPAQPGAQTYTQSDPRTIIEPSIEPSVAEYNIYALYLSVFKEPPISKEHDLLGELGDVYPYADILRVAKITKERDERKRILYKVGYMQGVLWGEARKNRASSEDDDDVVPHIGFGRTLIDLRPERLRSNA